jgi:hypothetical protein
MVLFPWRPAPSRLSEATWAPNRSASYSVLV